MNPLLLSYCERTATALFSSIWHGALLLGVAALALHLMPRLTATARSLIWTAALVLVVALPFFPDHSAQALDRPFDSSRVLHLNPAWSLAIASLWLALSIFRFAQLIASAVRLHTVSAKAEPVVRASTATVGTFLGVRRSATLCVSDEVAQPSVIGFFSPRILVPRDLFPKLSSGEIDHIVLHEMEHLRRCDDWRNLLQKLAVMLFPLNPALLWIERRLCFERELACDESVLAQTNAPKSYAACLVHLAEERSIGRQISLALGAWERRSELGRRVHGILSRRQAAPAGLRVACASLLTAGMVVCAFLLARTPQFVAFNSPAQAEAIAPASFAATARFHNASLRTASPLQPRAVNTMLRIPAASPPQVKRVHARLRTASAPRPIPRLLFENPAAQPRITVTAWSYNDAYGAVRVQRVTYAVYEVSRSVPISSETAQPLPSGLFILQL